MIPGEAGGGAVDDAVRGGFEGKLALAVVAAVLEELVVGLDEGAEDAGSQFRHEMCVFG